MRWLVTEDRDRHCLPAYHVLATSVFDSNLTHLLLPQGVYKCCSFFLQRFPSHFSPGRRPTHPSDRNLNITFLESYSLTPLTKPKFDVPVKSSYSTMCFPLHLTRVCSYNHVVIWLLIGPPPLNWSTLRIRVMSVLLTGTALAFIFAMSAQSRCSMIICKVVKHLQNILINQEAQ